MKLGISFSVVMLCAVARISNAEPATIEGNITLSEAPAFAAACTLPKNTKLGKLYESIAIIFTGQNGWIIAFDEEGKEEFLANSDPEYLVPFAWDIYVGIWLSGELGSVREALLG
ncbi:MAG: hypothetical protein IID51_12325, partial [Proteobacteria bacterium]|nr:hypothetical protein [Pseudomonadota bacterium]